MADIVLINDPRFEVSFWGLEHALPFIGNRRQCCASTRSNARCIITRTAWSRRCSNAAEAR
jgi:hypothetical protein